MNVDRSNLIQFMMEFFDDEEIVMLCLGEFREVYSNFALGVGKRQKVLRRLSDLSISQSPDLS